MDFPYYPLNDFGPVMHGMVIGGLGVLHVFLAQFAIGGGMLMCYFQWLAQSGRCPAARQFVDGYFKILVLISFVVGAVTGVGMWFTAIQVSPRTIGLMVREFHWIWAIEWTFFCLEVTAGYCFYRYGSRLDDRRRLTLLAIYSAAAWFSLFWINGILSWQLTPGGWLRSASVWPGFFNPSFFPSLLFRTVTSMAIAALVACVVINLVPSLDRATRATLINKAAHFLAPMILMPLLGLWYFASIPADSRSWVSGGSAAMSMFMGVTMGTSLLIGAYAFVGLLRQRLYINAATASLLVALAFVATGGGEFVREGIRKPYTVREALYSNSLTPADVRRMREDGCVAKDPYPLRDAEDYPNSQLRLGARVERFHCSVCHTMDGVNGLSHLTHGWSLMQKRLMIAKLQRTKPFMPPFAGTPEELEALVQLLAWHNAGRPPSWDDSRDDANHRQVIDEIATWLDEVGTKPGTEIARETTAAR